MSTKDIPSPDEFPLDPDQRPLREHMDDPKIKWRDGKKPDYTLVDELYMTEKTTSHKAGSTEKFVENFVKTWEMELQHKSRVEEWKTIDQENFTIRVNYGRKFTGREFQDAGSYAMLMWDSPLYDVSMETEQSAETLFRTVFKNGFAWELLELLSGPPLVSFTWRHWGKWEGPYRGTPPTGQTIELYGTSVVKLSEDLKIQSVNVIFDPNPMIATLMNYIRPGGCPYSKRPEQPKETKRLCPFFSFKK